MMILDSNIIIYSAKPENSFLRQFIAENEPSVSAISYVEVLGHHKLSANEKANLEGFFASAPMIPISQAILDHAVKLRQSRKMSLGDSLVAGTALTYDLTLVTRNTEDFKWIPDLKLLNPFEGRQPTIANP
jgi:predicted nucleic acid-binding protein